MKTSCLKCLFDEVFWYTVELKLPAGHLDLRIQAAKRVYDKNNQRIQTITCVCNTDWFRSHNEVTNS